MKLAITGNFTITDKFSYTFEPHYFYNVNDFNSSNGTKQHWEITNTFRYRINEHWFTLPGTALVRS
ncbi:KdgM Oligogalacturonate-specific porin protein [Salmonella bongori]|nr:KdgM Oligogalacturonate-specific porin protein [Salmonella bongori]